MRHIIPSVAILLLGLAPAYPQASPVPASDPGSPAPSTESPGLPAGDPLLPYPNLLAPEPPPGDANVPADLPAPPPAPNPPGMGGLGFGGFGGAGGMGGFGGIGGFGGAAYGSPGAGGMMPSAFYRVTWLPTQPVSGQNAHLGFVEQDLSFSCPLLRDDHNYLALQTGVRAQTYQTDALLPNSTQPFPDQFWAVNVGVMGFHRFDNGWVGGGMLSGGSNSNRPFADPSQLNATVAAFLRVPSGDHNAWNFSLFYSPLGQIPFPIPGVSYYWQPSDRFAASIGVPFQMRYLATDDIGLDFSYMLLTNVHARATFNIRRPLRYFLGYDWTNQGYFLSTPLESTNRFFYYQQRLATGAQYRYSPRLFMELSTGYAFDRFYSEGSIFGTGDQSRLGVGASPYLAGAVQMRW
jgi:hypothetical protein